MMKPGYATTEFWAAAFFPWLVLMIDWIVTGTLNTSILTTAAITNTGYAASRGITKFGQ